MQNIKRACWVLMVIALLLLSGCSKGPEYADSVFTDMDTIITLRLGTQNVDKKVLEEAAGQCKSIIEEMDALMSFHDKNSKLYALNQNAQMVLEPDSALLEILEAAYNLSALTNGAYDPSIGVLTRLWNVNGGGPVPEAAIIEEALSHCDPATLEISDDIVIKNDPILQIDLGGFGKGYTLQKLLDYLYTTEIPYGLVSMGGNIGVFGQKAEETPFQIGITDPANTADVLGYIYIYSGFVSVSGSYERFFTENGQNYHHILDPETGYPADSGLVSVVCYTQNGAAADVLSTALFVMGVDEGMELYRSGKIQFEAIFITEDGKIYCTDNIGFQLTESAYTLMKYTAPEE